VVFDPVANAEALRRLVGSGEAIHDGARDLRMVYVPRRPTVQLDYGVLGGSREALYADPTIQVPLYEQLRLESYAHTEAVPLVDSLYRLRPDGLVWGVVGQRRVGERYHKEAQMIDEILGTLRRDCSLPVALVDEGLSRGVPAIAALQAQRYSVPTLSFTPLQLLGEVAPRDYRVISTDKKSRVLTHGQMVGLAADVMVWCGGNAEVFASLVSTLTSDGVIVRLCPREYEGAQEVAQHLAQSPDMVAANAEGRIVTCSTVADVPEAVRYAYATAHNTAVRQRSLRLQEMHDLMLDG